MMLIQISHLCLYKSRDSLALHLQHLWLLLHRHGAVVYFQPEAANSTMYSATRVTWLHARHLYRQSRNTLPARQNTPVRHHINRSLTYFRRPSRNSLSFTIIRNPQIIMIHQNYILHQTQPVRLRMTRIH
jgi:hypothetical protein